MLYELYENTHYKEHIFTIVSILSREGLVEPIYQVELCCRSDCTFIKASMPADPAEKREYACPKCGSPLTVIKVYSVDATLSELKRNRGIDLPIFIREYLRFRSLDNVWVCGPCKRGSDELDVVVLTRRGQRVGIECKLFMKRKFTEHDARSQAGSIINDLEKYWNASLSEVVLVTNLEEQSAKMLEDELHRLIPGEKNIRVIHGDVNALISFLDSLI